MTMGEYIYIYILGGSSHLVRGYNPSYKWINPTYPIYNWGYNPLTSRGMSHQVLFWES